MKYLFALLTIVFLHACREPLSVPLDPEKIWIDEATHKDTVITGEGYTIPNYLYYAAKDWQTYTDATLSHGYRKITIRFGDSILVNPLTGLSTDYNGPYYFHIDESKTILHTQNFLDTSSSNQVRIFIQLR